MLRSIFLFFILFFLIFKLTGQSNLVIKSADFNSRGILSLLLDGQFNSKINAQKWKAPNLVNYTNSKSYAYTVCDTLIDFKIDTSSYRLVILKTMMIDPEFKFFADCNACPPLIGLAIFSKRRENWELTSFKIDVTRLGHFSEIPNASVLRIGNSRLAVRFKDEEVHEIGIERWFELNMDFKSLLDFMYSYRIFNENTSSNNEENTFYMVKELTIQESDKDYFDLVFKNTTLMSDNASDLELKPVKSELQTMEYQENLNTYQLVK
jgi:hypothetical protein